MSDDRLKKRGRGLKVEINSALVSSNLNLIRQQQKRHNPYLSQEDNVASTSKIQKRYQKGLRFYEKGVISKSYEQERADRKFEEELNRKAEAEAAEKQRLEAEARKLGIQKGDLPNPKLDEEKYIVTGLEGVPDMEWWDKPFLDSSFEVLEKYKNLIYLQSNGDDSDEEDAPSIRYVHHPTPVKLEMSTGVSKVFLTKDEIKKERRNRRKMQREELELKISLGQLPKPEPKVKLSNMMSVYENNQNITDPTAWEQTVRNQVETRRLKHEEINHERHQEAVERKKNNKSVDTNDSINKNCKVFKFKSLQNPQIRYKLKMNSKQLGLKGFCLRVKDDGPGVIIICGTEKSCRFFERLVCYRIKWDQSFNDKNNNNVLVDMTGNFVKKMWDGELKEVTFPNWFIKSCDTDAQLKEILKHFKAEHFYVTD